MSEEMPRSEAHPTDLKNRESQMDQRVKMVQEFQARSAARSDPLAANVGVILGDLMMFAHVQAASLQEAIGQAKTAGMPLPQDDRKAEMYLKFVRQLDRMVRVDRDLAAPVEEESLARRPRPSTRWSE